MHHISIDASIYTLIDIETTISSRIDLDIATLTTLTT